MMIASVACRALRMVPSPPTTMTMSAFILARGMPGTPRASAISVSTQKSTPASLRKSTTSLAGSRMFPIFAFA